MKRGETYAHKVYAILSLQFRWAFLASERCQGHCPFLSPISWRGLVVSPELPLTIHSDSQYTISIAQGKKKSKKTVRAKDAWERV
jgi:hypothetical protein